MSGGVFSVDILTKLKLVQFTPTNSKIYICMILTDFLAFVVHILWPKNIKLVILVTHNEKNFTLHKVPTLAISPAIVVAKRRLSASADARF